VVALVTVMLGLRIILRSLVVALITVIKVIHYHLYCYALTVSCHR
jgi:hypothetical protein